MKEYREYFKDPRWQKKRLEILNRDEFMCQRCYGTETELHIHHRLYKQNKKPWEYDNDLLLTLCKDCHANEKTMKTSICALSETMKKKFLSAEVTDLAIAFFSAELQHLPDVFMSALTKTIEDKGLQEKMLNNYFNHISKRQKKVK